MELRDYIGILKRHFIVFIAIIILTTVAAYAFTKMKPDSYTAQTTITVTNTSNLKQSQVNYYLFDNYYKNQSALLFSQTVSKWYVSDSFLNQVYQKAGIDNANSANSKFNVGASVTPTLTVSITGKDKSELTNMVNSSVEVVQSETDKINKVSDSSFTISSFAPTVAQNNPGTKLNTIIGFISGIILGYITIILIAYFKREKV
jgi:capsular polysaccharide biosynthesis protein